MKIVIAGAGEVGSHLAKMFRADNNDVTVIDNDAARLRHLGTYTDVEAIFGEPTSLSALKEAETGTSDLFIAVHPFSPQEVNLVAAMLARKLGAGKVIARISEEEMLSAENKQIFRDLGIELIFFPEKIAADEIVESLRSASGTEATEFGHGKLQLSMFRLEENSRFTDLKLSEIVALLSPEEMAQFRIIAVARQDKTIIPRFQTRFMLGDLVYVLSTREGLDILGKYFGIGTVEIEKVMIVGGGEIGKMVARSLDEHCLVKIIEMDKERCVELSEALPEDVLIINGDGRNPDLLNEEGIREYDAFMAFTEGDEENILACVVAKKFGIRRTIAEVENIEYVRLAEEMGVDTVINKKLLTASRIFKFTLSGKARFVKYMSNIDAEVLEYTAAEGSAITRKPIKKLSLPEDVIIGGVVRGKEAIIAVGDTQIQPGDRVAVFALPEAVKTVDKFFK